MSQKSLAKRIAQAKNETRYRKLSRTSLIMAGANPDVVKRGNVIEFGPNKEKILIV